MTNLSKRQKTYFNIPETYPDNLEDCLKLLSSFDYNCYGFKYVFLNFEHRTNSWDVTFRNPIDFDNPGYESKTPIEACHKMFDFLKLVNAGTAPTFLDRFSNSNSKNT